MRKSQPSVFSKAPKPSRMSFCSISPMTARATSVARVTWRTSLFTLVARSVPSMNTAMEMPRMPMEMAVSMSVKPWRRENRDLRKARRRLENCFTLFLLSAVVEVFGGDLDRAVGHEGAAGERVDVDAHELAVFAALLQIDDGALGPALRKEVHLRLAFADDVEL